MTVSVRVYQDLTNLNTEERKALYLEILEEDCFSELHASADITDAAPLGWVGGETE